MKKLLSGLLIIGSFSCLADTNQELEKFVQKNLKEIESILESDPIESVGSCVGQRTYFNNLVGSCIVGRENSDHVIVITEKYNFDEGRTINYPVYKDVFIAQTGE